jgi:hypothetical protein
MPFIVIAPYPTVVASLALLTPALPTTGIAGGCTIVAGAQMWHPGRARLSVWEAASPEPHKALSPRTGSKLSVSVILRSLRTISDGFANITRLP